MVCLIQMTRLQKTDIDKLARLARLELTEDERKRFEEQLSSILSYVEKLNAVETKGIEPTGHATGLSSVSRNDLVQTESEQTVSEILALAPRREGRSLRVKAVFDS